MNAISKLSFARTQRVKIAAPTFASLATCVALMGVASPASAASDLFEAWLNANSSLCVGVEAGNMVPGQPVIQWNCDGTANQSWAFISYGVIGSVRSDVFTGWGRIWNQDQSTGNFCLTAGDGSQAGDGTPVVIEPCSVELEQYQLWNAQGSASKFVLVNAALGLVVAVGSANLQPGAALIMWDDQVVNCGGSGQPACAVTHPEQQWTWLPIGIF
jgi:hypothetical protein